MIVFTRREGMGGGGTCCGGGGRDALPHTSPPLTSSMPSRLGGVGVYRLVCRDMIH